MAGCERVRVRAESPQDEGAIRRVNELAFGGRGEAALVDALRKAGAVTLSLVAEVGGQVAGHVLFTPVAIEWSSGPLLAVGLGPMAVLPAQQGQGIGTRLVRAATRELAEDGHCAVVVLGHPPYYPRFGFQPASRFGLRWEHPCPEAAFMALELRPGALAGHAGVVRYRPEFSAR